MNVILEKLGSYQILTNLLPGTFFGLILKFFFEMTLPTQNIGEDIVVYYFMGIIISRIGSLVVEPVLKKYHFIRYVPYVDYERAMKVDLKIDTLSEANSCIRSLLTCVLILLVIRILQAVSIIWILFSLIWEWLTIAILVVLFLFAYRKQTDYVCKRVESINNLMTNEKDTLVE